MIFFKMLILVFKEIVQTHIEVIYFFFQFLESTAASSTSRDEENGMNLDKPVPVPKGM